MHGQTSDREYKVKEKRHSFQFRVIDLGVGLYIKMDHCMVKRRETSVEIGWIRLKRDRCDESE